MTPRAQIEAFLRERPGLFAAVPDEDGSGLQLFETGTGKSLRVRWADLSDAVLRRTSLRPAPYLVLVFQDGRQLALADVGFAFAPSIASTGTLPDLPETFCFRDFRHLSQGIEAAYNEVDPSDERDYLLEFLTNIRRGYAGRQNDPNKPRVRG